MLAWYAGRFGTVEINGTFYRLPSASTVARWREATPPEFTFAVKASRYITHMRKLAGGPDAFARFFGLVADLGPKLGPILFQLPPRWHRDVGRLAAFLTGLPAGLATVFEFRDASWHDPEVYAALAAHGAAVCITDIGGGDSPEVASAPLRYVRLHGPVAPYVGSYEDAALDAWAARARAWRAGGLAVHIYFDNDMKAFAPDDAQRLLLRLAG